MAYIGNQPTDNFVTFATQNFSTSATSSYTLSHAVSNENEIALFINNVRQHPGSGKAYTASGTALTLSANTASTDVMYCIFLGRAIQSTVPATNSIKPAMLSLDDGVTITTDDNTDTLTLRSTDTDANSGPKLSYYRNSSSPADSDYIGQTSYVGRNDNSQDVNYVSINVQANDVSDGTEDGTYIINTMRAGALDQTLNISPTEVIINEDSKDVDFRVESNGQAHMLFVDAGNDRVGILDSSPAYTLESGNSDSGKGWSLAAENNVYKIRARSDASDTQTHIQFENTNGIVGTIKTNGTATQFNTSSDYRLKENIDYSWDATTRLKQLKPARFNWIADDTNTLLDGFIAHEVSSIVPEAISGNKDATETLTNVVKNADGSLYKCNFTEAEWIKGKADGIFAANSTWAATFTRPNYQGIDQSKLIPLLVKTIQELEARIKILEDA